MAATQDLLVRGPCKVGLGDRGTEMEKGGAKSKRYTMKPQREKGRE